jgi:alpha-tubulin suppressor-like RCC1 family protein
MRFGSRLPYLTLSLAGAAALFACTSSQDATDLNAPLNLAIALTPPQLQLSVADTITASDNVQLILSATSLGFPVITPHAEWTSSVPSVAVVDSTGLVRVVGLGQTIITARVNSETAQTRVTVVPRVVSATLTPQTFQGLVGDTTTLTATALDSRGLSVGGTSFTFTSNDPTTVNVTRTGNQTARITLLKAGNASVNVQADGQNAVTRVTALSRDFAGSIATSAPAGDLVLSAGEDATCGIIALGEGFCFGKAPPTGIAKDTSCFNDRAPVGPTPCTLVPLPIAGSLSFAAVSVGDSVACGVTTGNLAYCWGLQKYGQLGNGLATAGTAASPNLVVGAVSRSAVQLSRVSAGRNHACGLSPTGTALCWGQDALFQLGTGDTLHVNSTTPIPIKSGLSFTQISAGGDHTCALATGGTAVCWGDNVHGQVGNGTDSNAVDVPAAVGGTNVFVQITSGGAHTCALTAVGAAFCWGADSLGQLGNNSQTDSPTPVAVSGGLIFKSISAGRTSTCGITTAGAAFCWGSNSYGQIGNGFTNGLTPVLVPTAVTGGHTDFVSVTVGARHACALGTVGAFCWGSNVLGALGNEFQAMVQTTPTKTASP